MLSFMKLDQLSRIQTEANEQLKRAILNDRGKSWSKMAESYKKLLKMIAKSNLPVTFVPPPSYDMLLYESFYHFGVALQNLGRHKESIFAYTSAMNSMNLRKNGCLAGCNSNTCFHTPVLAKRSFAYAKAGDVKNAFKDIEKAVILDSRNPDLYCIRALMWNLRKEQQKAVEDLNSALKLNQCHVGALILRGNINQPMQMSFRLLQGLSPNAKKEVPKDHQSAIKFNSEAASFSDVGDVHHPKMIEFWNRFLRSLNIPRTVNHVDLVSAVLAQYNTTVAVVEDVKGNNGFDSKSTPSTPIVGQQKISPTLSSPVHENTAKLNRPKSMPVTPFCCGTPHETDGAQAGQISRSRRISYGRALRTYTARRQETGVSEYIQQLVKLASRPNTAKKKPNVDKIPAIITTKPPTPSPVPSRSNSRKSSATPVSMRLTPTPPGRLHNPTLNPHLIRRGSNISISSCPIPFNRAPLSQHGGSQRSLAVTVPVRRASVAPATSQPTHQQAAEFASTLHGIEVFQDVNISDAPRMYYKPWGGDKLPVAELPTRPKLEAFRV